MLCTGCKTSYKSHKNHPKVALFQFLSEEVLKNKCLKSIPLKNWTLSNSQGVCANHFYKNNLITKSTNKRHKKSNLPHQRSSARIRLKKNAVSSVFPTLPKYLTFLPNPNQRAGTSTPCARLERINGGNYFMCVKQLIQVEKKIRVLNFFKQNVLKSSSKLLTFD